MTSNKDLIKPTKTQIEAADADYPLLRPSAMQEMLLLFEENIGAAGIAPLDLPRIQCPSGGALNWIVQTLDGQETPKEIEGILVASKMARLYWKKAIGQGGGKKPPDCTSNDGFVGVGDPGGTCRDCPYAQFGSATKGHGQACKQIRQLLIVRPGETLPHLLSVPPTSLKAAGQYFLMLFGRQIPYWGTTTRLRLERATNEDGVEYAKILFAAGHQLSASERATLLPYHAQMKQLLDPMVIDARDYTTVEEGAPPAESGAGQAPNTDDVPF